MFNSDDVPMVVDDSSIAGGIYNHREIQITIKRDTKGYYFILNFPEKFKLTPNTYTNEERDSLISKCYNTSVSVVDDIYEKIINRHENNN